MAPTAPPRVGLLIVSVLPAGPLPGPIGPGILLARRDGNRDNVRVKGTMMARLDVGRANDEADRWLAVTTDWRHGFA